MEADRGSWRRSPSAHDLLTCERAIIDPVHSVAEAFRHKFAEAADSREPTLAAADFEHVSVDVHVPVLDIPNLPVKKTPRPLTKAVIQGKFEPDRRDYGRIFQELIASMNGLSCGSMALESSD